MKYLRASVLVLAIVATAWVIPACSSGDTDSKTDGGETDSQDVVEPDADDGGSTDSVSDVVDGDGTAGSTDTTGDEDASTDTTTTGDEDASTDTTGDEDVSTDTTGDEDASTDTTGDEDASTDTTGDEDVIDPTGGEDVIDPTGGEDVIDPTGGEDVETPEDVAIDTGPGPADPEGGCCFPDDKCVNYTELICADKGGTWSEEPCASDPCETTVPPEGDGACCYEDGGCSEGSAGECEAFGGNFSDAKSCTQVNCSKTDSGWACCTGVVCAEVDASECTGDYFEGLYCGEVKCSEQPKSGACCLPFGACMDTFTSICEALGGTFNEGKSCTNVTCSAKEGDKP